MMEVKVGISWLSWIFGLPVSFLGIVINLDNWKSAVIFVLATGFWLLKIWMAYRNHIQKHKEKELEIEKKKHDFEKEKNAA